MDWLKENGYESKDPRCYLNVQVEKENTEDVWSAIERMTGVVTVTLIEQDD